MHLGSQKQIPLMLIGCKMHGSPTSGSSFGQSIMYVISFAYNMHDVAMTIF
jgi:hypothetical protein